MKYASNCFSLQMLDNKNAIIQVKPCSAPRTNEGIYSLFGHEDIAKIAGFPFNREAVKLKKGDVLYVLQVTSGRLPANITVLPADIKLEWLEVTIL